MSLDPQAPGSPATNAGASAIENEIPAYRAVSTGAVFSVLLGVASILAFADFRLGLIGLAAILLGGLALRRIRRYPDILTGSGLAQAGIALGLICTLSAATFTFVREYKVNRSASAFGKRYLGVLEKGSLPDAYWYQVPAEMRKGSTPSKRLDEFEKAADPIDAQMQLAPLKEMLKRIAGEGGDIHYTGLEESGFDGLTPYGFILYEVHSKNDKGEEVEEYALAEIRSDPRSRVFNWHVVELEFPYKPQTRELQAKPIDDGHGHGH